MIVRTDFCVWWNRARFQARSTLAVWLLLWPLVPGVDGASATAEARRLRVDPAHPHCVVWGTEPQLLIGVSDRAALTIWQNKKGFDWRVYLETLASNGFNYVRQDLTGWNGLSVSRGYPGQFTEPAWAFRRTGPGDATDGGPRFDLSKLDESYFETRVGPFLEKATSLGIIVELTLFDDARRRRTFHDTLYSGRNNVNELGLNPGDDPHSDWALNRAGLRRIQEDYAKGVLRRTARFGNVIYEIANETGGRRWVAHFVDLIHKELPGALVSAGEQTSPYDPVSGDCDLVVKHRGTGGLYRSVEDVARHRRSLMDFRRGGKPVLHNEFFLFANRSTDDPAFVRWMFWGDFTAGGHVNFFDFTWWRGHGRTVGDGTPSQPPPEAILAAGRYLRRLIRDERIPFCRMEPRDEWAKQTREGRAAPFVFAEPGNVWLIYLPDGGRVRLRGTEPGDVQSRWYNPRTGESLRASTLPGPAPELEAPDEKDWVLVVRPVE